MRRVPSNRQSIVALLALCLTGVTGLATTSTAYAEAALEAGCPNYQVRWSTLDAGGGRALGPSAGWRLNATIGQSEPDLAPLCTDDGGAACAGARFTLRGGFWPGLDQTPSGVDCLFIDGFESPVPAPGA